MDIKRILEELRAERAQIDQAIHAIEQITSDGRSRSSAKQSRRSSRRRSLSTAARNRISQARKKWWAERKRKQKTARRQVAAKRAPKEIARKHSAAKAGVTTGVAKRLEKSAKRPGGKEGNLQAGAAGAQAKLST